MTFRHWDFLALGHFGTGVSARSWKVPAQMPAGMLKSAYLALMPELRM